MTRTNQLAKESAHSSKKMLFGAAALLLAIMMIIGAGFAYFSDIISGEGGATAGTLDIIGDLTLTKTYDGATPDTTEILTGSCSGADEGTTNDNEADCETNNGTWDPTATDTNFNPGDAIAISGTVENVGSKSAWVRQALTINTVSNTANSDDPNDTTGDLANYLFVCIGPATQNDLMSAALAVSSGSYSRDPGDPITVTGTTCTKAVAGTTYAAANSALTIATNVISGTKELDGGALNSSGHGAWTVDGTQKITLFFDPLAPNAAQLGNATFTVKTQALQYRNNTTPTDAAWATVTSTEFAI